MRTHEALASGPFHGTVVPSPAFRRLALALLAVALGVIVLLVVVAAGDDPSPSSRRAG